ncbi:hypothetical protein ABOZ73_03150 [Caulobacter sp. 73W]|uniref:Uncharacterized protein n=1 Tax=Caulobacter sp. 73W TaxID=3161137 RepID=A0AB39KW32_9CAUL
MADADDDLETLKQAVRDLQAESFATRALLPWLIGVAVSGFSDDPEGRLRELHEVAQGRLYEMDIGGEEDAVARLKDRASLVLDDWINSIQIERGE